MPLPARTRLMLSCIRPCFAEKLSKPHPCPCPPVRNWCCHVYGLVITELTFFFFFQIRHIFLRDEFVGKNGNAIWHLKSASSRSEMIVASVARHLSFHRRSHLDPKHHRGSHLDHHLDPINHLGSCLITTDRGYYHHHLVADRSTLRPYYDNLISEILRSPPISALDIIKIGEIIISLINK